MNLTVFGPTDPTGAQIVRRALAAGHEATAVAPAGTRLRVVPGDVLVPVSLSDGVAGSDAVLSAIGVRRMGRPTTVYSAGTANVLAAMRDAGVRRFVGVTAIPVGPDDRKGAFDRYLLLPLLRRFFGGGYEDMRRMEGLLASSDRDWTVFRPPQLTDKAPTGRFRVAVDGPLPRTWSVPRADLAAAMLAAVEDPALVGHAVTIAV